MTVDDLLVSAKAILNDAGAVTYTEAELLQGITLACDAVCIYRPDASMTVDTVSLSAGVRQRLPNGGQRVMAALSDGTGAFVRVVDLMDHNAAAPSWRAAAQTPGVQDVMVDERAPGFFWVSPPNDGNGEVELLFSTAPATVTDSTALLPVSDKYAPPVLEWLLYLMFSRDSERSPNNTRAQGHQKTFFDLLGVKTQSDRAFSPSFQNQMPRNN